MEKMTFIKAKEIVKHGVIPGEIDSIDLARAEGYISALNGPEVKELVKALERIDKRCLKYGVLPDKQTCLDIRSEGFPFCHGCFAEEAISEFKSILGDEKK